MKKLRLYFLWLSTRELPRNGLNVYDFLKLLNLKLYTFNKCQRIAVNKPLQKSYPVMFDVLKMKHDIEIRIEPNQIIKPKDLGGKNH